MNQDGRAGERLARPLRLFELPVAYIEAKAPLIFTPPLFEVSRYKQGQRPIEVCSRIVRVEGQRAPIAGKRLGIAPLTLESAAQIVVCLRLVRLQGQRSFVMGERLLQPPQI